MTSKLVVASLATVLALSGSIAEAGRKDKSATKTEQRTRHKHKVFSKHERERTAKTIEKQHAGGKRKKEISGTPLTKGYIEAITDSDEPDAKNTDEPKKKRPRKARLEETVAGEVHQAATSQNYTDRSVRNSATHENTKIALQALSALDWSGFQWAKLHYYSYFTEVMTPQEYLELVASNDFSVFDTLAQDLVEKKAYGDKHKAIQFIMQVLGAVDSRYDVLDDVGDDKPFLLEVTAQIQDNNLLPEQWPAYVQLQDQKKEFYKLLKDFSTTFRLFQKNVLTHQLTNILDHVFDYVDERKQDDDGDGKGWTPGFSRRIGRNHHSLKETLDYFPADDRGQVIFYILTGTENEDENFVPESDLIQKFISFISSTWSSFENDLKTITSLFLLKHIKINPLSLSAKSSRPKIRIATYSSDEPSTSEENTTPSPKQVLDIFTDQFYTRLISVLPMDDVIFMSQIYSKEIITGQQKAMIDAAGIHTQKAAFFLDKIIIPSLNTNSLIKFNKLVNIMKKSDDITLKSVGKEIEEAITPTHKPIAKPVAKPLHISQHQAQELMRISGLDLINYANMMDEQFITTLEAQGLFPLDSLPMLRSYKTNAGRCNYFSDYIKNCPESVVRFINVLQRERSFKHQELHTILMSNLASIK